MAFPREHGVQRPVVVQPPRVAQVLQIVSVWVRLVVGPQGSEARPLHPLRTLVLMGAFSTLCRDSGAGVSPHLLKMPRAVQMLRVV